MDVIYAVVADIKNKEHFVEIYHDTELYKKVREKRNSENSDLKFQSVFASYKDAIREAKRLSKPSYIKGWNYNEKRNMTIESNYEKYATIRQQRTLRRERNLQQAISCLRDRQRFASLQCIDNAIDFVADLYDLSIDEVKRAMDGEEYWIV